MILLSRFAQTPECDRCDFPACQTSVVIPFEDKIDTREYLDRQRAGTLNTSTSPACGGSVTAKYLVYIDLPEPGIPHLIHAPLSLLDDDAVCEELNVDGRYRFVCYSLDELARQVRARLRLHNFKTTSQPTR